MVDSNFIEKEEEEGIDTTLYQDRLPSQLKDLHGELQRIIRGVEVPEDLPEDQNWPWADQVEAIAEKLMSPDGIGTHLELRHRKIGYFFRSSLKDNGQPALGKGTKCGAKIRELSGYEFIVQINHQPYMHLPPHRKIRTIDHELCHLTLDMDDNPDVRPHDIEEFTEVARRWGLKTQQVDFGKTVQQLDLLEDTSDQINSGQTENETEPVPA